VSRSRRVRRRRRQAKAWRRGPRGDHPVTWRYEGAVFHRP